MTTLLNVVLVAVLVSVVFFENVSSRLTEKQVAATIKLVRNMCLGKAKTTPEEVDKTHQGNWDIDNSAKCFLHCVLHTNKIMDNDNKFDMEGVKSQLSVIPESMIETILGSTTACEHAATDLSDKCNAAWEYAKCIYDWNPEKYFLP